MAYTKSYFRMIQDGSLRSAQVVVPLITKFVKPASVIDIGCGVGTWLSIFKKNGIKNIRGVDGSYVDRAMLHIAPDDFLEWDLTKPLRLKQKFDLAMCLEVAEHLPKESAKTLINTLINAAPVILFSAAIPFQSGNHHVNEQWPQYWVKLFLKKGYVVIDCLRRRVWDDPRVEFWYAQNMLVFVKKQSLGRYPLLKRDIPYTFLSQLALVHPKMYVSWSNSLRKIKKWTSQKLPRASKLMKNPHEILRSIEFFYEEDFWSHK